MHLRYVPKNGEVRYHKMDSWKKEGYFQSAMRGQEFVIKNNEEIEEWTKTLISGM
jgi:hypothetical protein